MDSSNKAVLERELAAIERAVVRRTRSWVTLRFVLWFFLTIVGSWYVAYDESALARFFGMLMVAGSSVFFIAEELHRTFDRKIGVILRALLAAS